MSAHPLNLALLFVLEMAGLYAMGYWGWTEHEGTMRYVLAIGLPLVAAVFGSLVLFHYLISYDRVRWMLTGARPA